MSVKKIKLNHTITITEDNNSHRCFGTSLVYHTNPLLNILAKSHDTGHCYNTAKYRAYIMYTYELTLLVPS